MSVSTPVFTCMHVGAFVRGRDADTFRKAGRVVVFFVLFSITHVKGFSEQLLHHRSPAGPEPGPSDVPARANKASVRDLPLFFPPHF